MNMHNTPARLPAVMRRTDCILTAANHQEIRDFTRALEEAVLDIERASRQSSEVKDQAGSLMNSLESRNWWGQLTSGLSGNTDKELAILVQGLGASLVVTQKVLQVMLKVMTQKNQVLQGFNEALVNKIAMVTADTKTLDGNQKVVVKAFLGQLQQQVCDQLQQQDMVDSLELRMIDCEAWREEKEIHEQFVNAQLTRHEQSRQSATSRTQELEGNVKVLTDQTGRLAQHRTLDDARITELLQKTQAFSQQLPALDNCNRVLAGRVDVLEAERADLARQMHLLTERAKTAEAALAQQSATISQLQQVDIEQKTLLRAVEQRLSSLETIDSSSRTTKALAIHYAPALVACLLGALAIYLSLAT